MPRLGITEAFRRYGAELHNPQWSVSAWAPDGSLVVSLWDHHFRKGPPGTLECTGKLRRWSGPGNTEFRENIQRAFTQQCPVRLVIARTPNTQHVDAGRDASLIDKEFFVREDVVGTVLQLDGDDYVFQFRRSAPGAG